MLDLFLQARNLLPGEQLNAGRALALRQFLLARNAAPEAPLSSFTAAARAPISRCPDAPGRAQTQRWVFSNLYDLLVFAHAQGTALVDVEVSDWPTLSGLV